MVSNVMNNNAKTVETPNGLSRKFVFFEIEIEIFRLFMSNVQ